MPVRVQCVTVNYIVTVFNDTHM